MMMVRRSSRITRGGRGEMTPPTSMAMSTGCYNLRESAPQQTPPPPWRCSTRFSRNPTQRCRTKLDHMLTMGSVFMDTYAVLREDLSSDLLLDEPPTHLKRTVEISQYRIPVPVVDSARCEQFRCPDARNDAIAAVHVICNRDGMDTEIVCIARLCTGLTQRYILSSETLKWERTLDTFGYMLETGYDGMSFEWS